jgi:hypothetical protein
MDEISIGRKISGILSGNPKSGNRERLFATNKTNIGMSQADAINIVKAYLKILIKAGIPITDLFDTNDDYILSRPWLFTAKIDHRIEPIAIGTLRFLMDDISPLIEIVRKEGVEILPQ